jgi:anti-sigma regulatory factor (Ser/Thr protein kinase)
MTVRSMVRGGTTSGDTLALVVDGGPEAASEARNAVGLLGRDVGPAALHSLRLLVSELVTNSIVHGRAGPDDPVRLDAYPTEDALRVEVTDRGPGFDHSPGPSEPLTPGGLGLVIVDHMASRWGTENDGRCVWFELARTG